MIYSVIILVGVLADDIEVVFSIVGAICATSIGALLPMYFYVNLISKKRKPKKFLYYLSIVLGCILAPYSLFSIVAKFISE